MIDPNTLNWVFTVIGWAGVVFYFISLVCFWIALSAIWNDILDFYGHEHKFLIFGPSLSWPLIFIHQSVVKEKQE